MAYGNGDFRMMILLPQYGSDLETLTAELTPEHWAEWTSCFSDGDVELALPRFELKFGTSLVDALTALGMGVAFGSDSADFTGISAGGNLFINDVLHKALVKVDEEGTEAAAVTAVVTYVTSSPEPIEVRVDQPFLFLIHDAHSGAILFLGRAVNLGSS